MPDRFQLFKECIDFDELSTNLKSEEYYYSLTNETPDIEITKNILKAFKLRNGRNLTEMYDLTGILFSADVFLKYVKESLEIYGL